MLNIHIFTWVFKKKLLSSENINDKWSKHQLIHAVSIMVYYHMLSCFCQSIGLSAEMDCRNEELLQEEERSESHTENGRERNL